MTAINRIRWWVFGVQDSTELADLLNDMESRGLEKDHVLGVPPGPFVVTLKMFVTIENQDIANILDKEYAETKKAAGVLSPSGLSVGNSETATAPVGTRRRDNKSAK